MDGAYYYLDRNGGGSGLDGHVVYCTLHDAYSVEDFENSDDGYLADDYEYDEDYGYNPEDGYWE